MSRQIVITLPEWTEIKQIDNKQFADLLPAYDEMLNMIKNGTLLPKGHGDLIDRNEIEYLKAIHDLKWGKITAHECATKIIHSAPTIIEADTAESEE